MSHSNEPRRGGAGTRVLLVFLILVLIAGSAAMVYLCIDLVNKPSDAVHSGSDPLAGLTEPQDPVVTVPTETEPPETTMPEPEHVVSTATVTATGDILLHTPIYLSSNAACNTGNNTYNFDPIFKYITDHTTAADYMVGNLEVTLRGTEKPFGGYPYFNSPDDIVDACAKAGFDMLLTANNHSNDTGLKGITRTLEVIREGGLDTLGTQLSAEEPKYVVKDLNGIQVGMVCYTYEISSNPDIVSLNGNPVAPEGKGMVNAFDYGDLDTFYGEVEQILADMKAEGAEASIIYLHWGTEYLTYASDQQKAMAQKLCDLGVDVIVGGHPHVIQPIELLTSAEDPGHKTVCLYSLGNAVSNQRLGNISYVNIANTEDGMLFNITFEKYSDGTVYLANVDVVPVWVNMYSNAEQKREYNMLPLVDSQRDSWMEMFQIPEHTFNAAVRSYDRTMDIVGEGLAQCQEYLENQKLQRDADYLDAVMNPGRARETVPAETAAPTVPETTEAAA